MHVRPGLHRDASGVRGLVRGLDLERAADKLQLRGGLPGAFGYDLAAHAFRRAQNAGVDAIELLPAAMPTSWMVNAKATSPVFKRWLGPACLPAWATLVDLCRGGAAAWDERTTEDREAVEAAVRTLSIAGQGPCAISKVLALLVPETVPLMDDAAIACLTGGVAAPADEPTCEAGPEHFVPMLDAFGREVTRHRDALVELARGYPLAPLDDAQVADRLLWFDSWGRRHFPAFGEATG